MLICWSFENHINVFIINLLEHFTKESAKLRALRAKNELACQRALPAYVLTCLRALCAYVLTCVRALRASVLTCLCALRAYLLTCQSVLRAYVLTCKRAILNNVNLYIIQVC